jgi:uncharacterized protein YbjT (DUF2867 family)
VILVAGGSGTLGTCIVRRLVASGVAVRVLTRDPARAAHLAGERVHVVEGDVRDPAAVTRAVTGVDTVISAVHGFAGPGGVSPASVDRDGNAHLVDAAAAAGCAVVLVSVVGAAPDSPMELFRMKDAAERHVRASGAPFTIVRATAFLETWAMVITEMAGTSDKAIVFGSGRNPINFVAADDVAAAVALAATDPALRGVTLEVGGPDNLPFDALVAALGKSPRHVPVAMLRAMSWVLPTVNPELGRKVEAALLFESGEMAFDGAPLRAQYPGLPYTPVAAALARWSEARGQRAS